MALKQADHQMHALEKAAPLDLEATQRAGRIAAEDWKQYQDVEKPLAAKIVDFQLKMNQEMYDDQNEEYRQLEKMYRKDELTEETEKIVLQRARNAVERAKFQLQYAQVMHDEAQKFILPRQDAKIREQTRRIEIETMRAKLTLPLALGEQRLKLERLKVQRDQAEERLDKLLADRAAMTVTAATDGVVYYGSFARGKWAASASTAPFRRGAPIQPNEVVMTVVEPRPLAARALVSEEKLQYLRAGLQGIAVPAAFPDTNLSAIVRSISDVPVSGTSFDAQFTLGTDGLSAAIVAGMTCELKFIAYKQPQGSACR